MSIHDLTVSTALTINHLFEIQKLEAVREAFTSKKALQNARQFYYETLGRASCCSVDNFTGKFGGIFGDLDEEPHQVGNILDEAKAYLVLIEHAKLPVANIAALGRKLYKLDPRPDQSTRSNMEKNELTALILLTLTRMILSRQLLSDSSFWPYMSAMLAVVNAYPPDQYSDFVESGRRCLPNEPPPEPETSVARFGNLQLRPTHLQSQQASSSSSQSSVEIELRPTPPSSSRAGFTPLKKSNVSLKPTSSDKRASSATQGKSSSPSNESSSSSHGGPSSAGSSSVVKKLKFHEDDEIPDLPVPLEYVRPVRPSGWISMRKQPTVQFKPSFAGKNRSQDLDSQLTNRSLDSQVTVDPRQQHKGKGKAVEYDVDSDVDDDDSDDGLDDDEMLREPSPDDWLEDYRED
ncbi:hypothetical protein HDU98_006492 [Podochytrium sp. JEL0797]|nr:hypothetical protein HDU98_006492 [Podochytrium sp. JEL0797]